MTDAISLANCAKALTDAGYDVVVSDVVIGRQERADQVREAIIDAGGRLRLTATRVTEPPHGERMARRAWRFRLLRERREVITIMTELERCDDLAGALREAEELISEERAR